MVATLTRFQLKTFSACALLSVLLAGCRAHVGSSVSVPEDAAGTCATQCQSIGMHLSAVAIMANNVGCVCEHPMAQQPAQQPPAQPSPAQPSPVQQPPAQPSPVQQPTPQQPSSGVVNQSGSAAAGMATILLQRAAAERRSSSTN